MTPSLASVAQYFRIGLQLGICAPDEVRDWAISVIERMDAPPGEIIEVSWHKPRAQMLSDLNEVKGQSDLNLVCRWLLGKLSSSTGSSLRRAIQQAMGVAQATGSSDLYFVFDGIEDELSLAETETWGTVAECKEDFDNVLKEFGIPPFSG